MLDRTGRTEEEKTKNEMDKRISGRGGEFRSKNYHLPAEAEEAEEFPPEVVPNEAVDEEVEGHRYDNFIAEPVTFIL